MNKSGKYVSWIEAGYEMFAREGMEGIQVERLARILDLNKSGFYHYFGDRTTYIEHLMDYHQQQIDSFIEDIDANEQLDPGFLRMLAERPMMLMVNMQLVRNRQVEFFAQHAEVMHAKISKGIMPLWLKHLGLTDAELGDRYLSIVRDVTYSRMNFNNLNYDLFHKIMLETKSVIDEIALDKSHIVAADTQTGFLRQA